LHEINNPDFKLKESCGNCAAKFAKQKLAYNFVAILKYPFPLIENLHKTTVQYEDI